MKTKRTQKTTAATMNHDHVLHLLRSMIRIRRLEDTCAELYTAMKIRGFLHLYDGEEAIAVGVLESLTPDDAVVATYREHGHVLIRGVPMAAILAEMYGKQEGCSRGRGGSMHLFDSRTRFYGGNAIVGGGLPIAAGLALADRMQQKKRVTCCFFGDGAVAEGEFHESMNLASLWKLPVLFVCENNLYAMGTALKYTQSVMDLASKASSYDIPATVVDGMDVLAVETAARKAADAVRSGEGPRFLECRTYRFRAHSMYDAELYRSKAEVAEWKKRCPIATLTQRLKQEGLLTDGDLAEIGQDITREINEAVTFAEAGAWEPVEDLTRFVYSERRTS
ncbi:MAG: pyruvate dehydrogenase (acetyl-transferring) E1 component subunit alpha [Desulfatirhabdiaceae bacterium]